MASARPPPARPLDLDLTIVSAKHLKNVNWKSGVLKPYCVIWVDPNNRVSTRSDDSGFTRPMWNEKFTLPLILPLHESVFALDIFHSIPSDTPKPLVGTLRLSLGTLPDPDDLSRIRTFDLIRPSGRPQGKIRVKIGFRERPVPPPPSDYYPSAPPPLYPLSHYYPSAPPPLYQSSGYREYSPTPYPHFLPQPSLSRSLSLPSYAFQEPYNPYSSGCYYSSAPPPPHSSRPFYDRMVGGYCGPSAPFDFNQFDQKPRRSGKTKLGTGSGVGVVAGALGGLAVGDGEKIAETRAKINPAVRDDYSDYHVDY